jgi:hypothetical protein
MLRYSEGRAFEGVNRRRRTMRSAGEPIKIKTPAGFFNFRCVRAACICPPQRQLPGPWTAGHDTIGNPVNQED